MALAGVSAAAPGPLLCPKFGMAAVAGPEMWRCFFTWKIPQSPLKMPWKIDETWIFGNLWGTLSAPVFFSATYTLPHHRNSHGNMFSGWEMMNQAERLSENPCHTWNIWMDKNSGHEFLGLIFPSLWWQGHGEVAMGFILRFHETWQGKSIELPDGMKV